MFAFDRWDGLGIRRCWDHYRSNTLRRRGLNGERVALIEKLRGTSRGSHRLLFRSETDLGSGLADNGFGDAIYQ